MESEHDTKEAVEELAASNILSGIYNKEKKRDLVASTIIILSIATIIKRARTGNIPQNYSN